MPRTIFGEDFKKVYEPSEDTFLLLDSLEQDLPSLESTASICLECGSGSGLVITALSKALQNTGSTRRLMIATDINAAACKTTRKCADFHQQEGIQIVRTNLAESLVDRLKNCVDLLIFNPPYVPTELSEIESATNNQLCLSWAGGQDGRRTTDVFLRQYVPQLLSKPHGVAYLVAIEANNIEALQGLLLTDHGIDGSVIMRRRAGIESLSVIKYTWTNQE